MAHFPPVRITESPSHRLIVTIAFYGPTNFQVSQNEFSFASIEELDRAQKHFVSDHFRKNIEGGGAFVKVDAYQV